ncbi:MAG: hypothetical protein JO269_08170 [Burkholderiaceae bacterium]|nr:hypothetical protein [Burkholderiaceae bacterium]
MRFLIWLVVGFAVVTWFMRLKAHVVNSARHGSEGANRKPRSAVPVAEAMLQCAHCGVHFPASEAFVDPDGAAYCSEDHRAQRTLR